ncbi:amino acid adenylation domain-containing protein, partial [Longimicrobium sp.]|uniref:non-ribosomal peptide synthetase n=1 Tax=Longimicrobium sp. TaxID=2029185 RepID=UPI003B3A2B89
MSSDKTVESPRPELSAAKRALVQARLKGRVRSFSIVPRGHRDGAPLSFAQERLWFLDRLEPGSTTYNMLWPLRLRVAPDTGALERALGEIVRRHESLRTVVREVDGAPVQVVVPFAGFPLDTVDLSRLAEGEREAEMRRRVSEEAARPFDLATGPLFRASLLRLGEDDHVLLLSMHHIVSDEWSMGVLSREFSVLYEAYRAGRESPLPELVVQYADYAAWQREQLEGAALERQLGYWRARLADAPVLLELPTDHPRPAVQTFRGAVERIELSAELLERLQALGRGEGATLYMVALAAFQVLLSRYSGSEDVVVGSPIAGRERSEVEGLIGFFVNTLVLRTDLAGDPSFRELLGRVREGTLGAYENQEVPFEKLVAELQPERSLSHAPLFQVQFTLQDTRDSAGGLAELGTERVDAGFASAKFDLSLTVATTPQGLRCGLSYATDLFERGTIVRLLGHLGRVLEQVAADADVRLSEIELLGEAERARVVDEWNRTEAEAPADRCIHQLFEAQAARTPDVVAVRFEDASLTCAQLNARANQLAHHLRRQGVGPEVRVGVLMERSLEMVVSLLAVLKAGGAYVPLDPGLPAERLAYMLEDADVAVLLTQERLRGIVPDSKLSALEVDAAWDAIARESAENPAPDVTPSNVAYVIYTSGSTGRPKGVMNQHRGVVNRLVWMQAHFGLSADDVVLQKTPFSFDVSVWEFFWPLQQGATLVMARPDGHRDPAYLQEVIEAEGVTTLHFVPSMLQSFVEAVEAGRCASLRHVVCSGEALPPALVHRFYDRFAAPVVLTNLYGPTEAAVDVSCWTCPRDEAADVVPIGRPVWNTQLYVLDAALNPAPVGVPGELYIGGVQVARGYQGRAAMTAERFIPDPFSSEPGARLYRTGDRARWRADGAIEYLGRLDFQVKVRGFRIELGEIEGVLRRSEGVTDCVVLVRADAGEQRLVAYVVGAAKADVLREHLRRELPEYMVPAAFVALDALPLTANGKLDRKALPAPEGDAYARRSYEAPLGEIETALAEIWGEVLGVERVGRWDHFFELGGHSLLAIKLIGRMRSAGLHADVRALFTTPVLAELALAVGGASAEVEIPANGIPEGSASITPEMLPLVELSQAEIDRIVAAVPGGAANVQDIYPLAALQEGILFHHLMSEEGDPYLLSSTTEFDSRARLDQYLAALRAVIDRHDILRTAMAWDGLREPVQVVLRHAPLPVEEVRLDAEAGDAAGELWRHYDPRRYRMDLGRAPLLRACIAEDRPRGRWLLLMLMHHLTNDHESLEVLREEISAHLRGLQSELPAPLPFRNYVAGARLGVSREEHERFFHAMLGDVEEPTAPYGLLDVWGEGHGIGEARLPVAHDVGARLRLRARALGVSAASLCHLAWAQVLARLSGRRDVVFGTLLFGRMQGGEGTDRVMGPLINTLPVRIGVGAEGVESAVRRTHALLADLLRHEHASLALAQRSSGVAAPAPLFTSLLNYRYGGRAARAREAGQAAEGVRGIRGQERTNYPVVLSVDDRGEEFSLLAQVAAPADAELVCRMMHTALAGLVEALEAAPGRPIGSIDVLPEAERRVVVEAWNRTDAAYPTHLPIHQLFEEQVRRTPDAAALVWGAEELTYRELDSRANRLAHHLAGLGVGPESRVGLRVERGVENVVATLAVLKAGGCCVPVDTSYPAERMALMLADSAVRILLSDADIAAPDLHVIRLDQAAELLAAHPDHPLSTDVAAGNLAYVFYTSGSTGRPKGVMMGHREVVQYAYCLPLTMPLGPGDRVAQASNASFDAAVFEIWGALVHGATLVGIDRDVLLSAPLLGQALREQGITHLYQTAALFTQHVREQVDVYATLRQLVFGAEAVGTDSVRRMLREGKPARVLHEYGPTEATVWCTLEVVEEVAEDAPTVLIGKPIPNARAYVLDPAGQPLPAGVPGELCIGGDGVVRGYLGRPAQTAERFVPDPFAAQPGARMYRTGDRARWKAEGKLEFLGRVDDQVKIRGFRIEPGEVEAAVAAFPGVREARVMMREDQPGDKRLVAYVVGEMETDALREHLRQSLPEYMVPRAIVAMDRLPLNANGKVDRKALPVPEYAAGADRYVAPRTPTEEVLAGIWAEVLHLDRVGVEESFFDLGGHSLLGTRVVSRVRGLFGVELPLRALFEGPTVAEMAGRVEEMRRAQLPVLPPVVPAERTDPLPLSFAQERLWFIDRLERGSAVYNIPVARRLKGALDGPALERALGEIVRRHEALRTVFAELDGSPVQVIAPFGGFALAVEDLSALDEADREAAVRRRAGEEARRAFDLSAGPLFRAALLRLGAEEHVLLLTMHHIVSDGWSMGVLFRELWALYAAFAEGRESPLAELAVQYADYAVWQREQLAGETLDRQLAYWRERLAGAPALLELPTDHPRPPVQTYRGATVPVALSSDLLERLQRLGRSEGATLYMTLLGAFQVLLSKYAGSEDVVVGSPIAGRTRGEVEALIGFFVNTLVLRTDLGGDPSFRQVLGRVREATLGAYAHQELPFEKLVAELQPERSLSHSPLFQVLFALQNAEGGASTLHGLEVSGAGTAREVAQFDLSLTLWTTGQGLRGALDYSTDLFERATVERMLGHLERVLEQVAADADVRLSRLELVGEAERARVLDEWNRTEAEVPAGQCIHQLIEAQAARTPDAVAVIAEEASLTCAQLNARANQLAHHLARRGVGPETRVGLCLERGVEMVVSILAVLKAGGAYVPLDPGYPPERLAYMLEDSGVAVLLTQSRLRGILPASDVPTLDVDAAWNSIAAESAENPAPAVTPSNLAYVIYTSGSTGRPKGVMNAHRGVVNRLWWMQAEYGIGADDVVLQKTPFSFDVSVWEFFWPLQQGATLVMARPDGHRDPLYLQDVIERRGVTTLHFVPSMLQQFVETADPARCTSLRRVICSGEALPPALVARFHERFPAPVELHNLYGPTEAAVDVSHWACARQDAADVVPIGRPVWNTQLYVLDAALTPAPVGVPGELYIGGVQVARGYLGRPGLTAERFIPDPFSARPGARLYRTGDKSRWRADGAIEYLGRLDFQVKVRGFRIELGEIEGVLRRSEGVVDCAVIAREDETGDRRLVAYVVGEAETETLREHLRRELPEYMVPAAFVPLDALPLTANGKLDRKALPAPEGDAYARRSYEAPLGEIETALAEIWGELLGVERVGRWDHFFELGGHSLLAMKLIERMRRAGLYTDVRALFTTPVLAELALAVGRASMEMEIPANAIPAGSESITPDMLPLVELTQAEIDRIVAGVPGGAANVQDIYPLAPLQEGILFHHLLSEEGDPYLLSSTTEFDTRAHLDQYLAALQAVIDRHDVLRTAVAWEGLREPVQVVWRRARLPVEEVELDVELGDAAGQLWRRYDPRRYRMDLGQAPLRRAAIAEDRARGRWLLLVLTHHLTSDHESLEVQREEISAHLRGVESELAAPLPFRGYVAQARLGVSREEHERFFRGMLGDVDEPTAPYGLLDVWGDGRGIAEARLPVADNVAARLRRRARTLGVSAASLCHLAWAQVLARLSGREDVVFGTLLFGRMQGGEGADRVMGPLINTLPVRIGVGEEAAEAAVRRTHALLADLLRHEHASLALAQRSSGVAAPAPLFTSVLNYRYGGTKRPRQAGPGREGVRGIGAQERTNYPVALAVDDWGDAFSLVAQVAAPADAERVCRMMHAALEGLAEALECAPRRAIGSIDVLPESERARVVGEWSRTETDAPADRCAHELFAEQAARTPDAVAVRFGAESLKYAELDARANRLAHHRRALGVGPEVRVGLCLERSPEMVVAVLGVLKAGGAYVPLDPAYPAERLAFMLRDAAVPVLLTHSALEPKLPAHDARVVRMDADAAAIGQEPGHAPESGVDLRNLAYIIYTSGSTGRPKGAAIPHGGLARYLAWAGPTYGAGDGEGAPVHSSLSFDLTVTSLFVPLLAGEAVVLAADEGVEALAGVIRSSGTFGFVKITPAHLSLLLEQLSPEEAARATGRFVVGGESLAGEVVARWGQVAPNVLITNEYGPTETVVGCSIHTLYASEAPAGAVSIGRPSPGTALYVLDTAGQPAPVGVPGELHVGGGQLGRGYLARPALTAEKYVPDPFSLDPGARLYRTGDLVRWGADGELEFLGRLDEQVKIRGFRIELGEIEAALRQAPGVDDGTVIVREDGPGDRRLVAYVVGDAEAEALRERLLQSLPEYMVPAAFVPMDALPLTPNGKLDRKALPAPEGDAYARRSYEAPLGETETALAEIWAEVLGVERVGRWDHFFELGGHSLLAIRLIGRMRSAGLHTDVRALFTTPVLAELAQSVGGAAPELEIPANAIPDGAESITPDMLPLVELDQVEIDRIVAAVPGGAANVQDIYPLAPLQEGILFHHLMSQEGDPYLLSGVSEFDTRPRL